jgi:hypothetical protein
VENFHVGYTSTRARSPQKIEPCSLFTWKRRLESLAQRVKSQRKTVEPAENAKIAKFAIEQLTSPKKKEKEFEMLDAVELITKLDVSMMSAIRNISAETMLNIAFVIRSTRRGSAS